MKTRLFVWLVSMAAVSALDDTHSECGSWAAVGECRKNPGFMLDGCRRSCEPVMEQFNKEEHNCEQWASETECSRNPSFMQLHCSGQCGNSWMWSPWARRQIGLQPPTEEKWVQSNMTETSNPSLEAALQLGQRLHQLVHNANNTFALSHDMNSFMEGISVGELLLCAANSAVVAIKGLAAKRVGAWEILGGNDAETLSESVRQALRDGPDRVHREFRYLVARLERIVATLHRASRQEPEFCTVDSTSVAPNDKSGDIDDIKHTSSDLSTKELIINVKAGFISWMKLPEVSMPMVGVGTCWLSPEETYWSVRSAIENGVRHIDTAEAYRNEEAIGRAIRDAGVPRSELFVATKISSGESHGYEETKRLIARQLDDLGTTYVDLYYIHGMPQAPHSSRFPGTWKALSEYQRTGTIRLLGISNFNRQQIEAMVYEYDSPPQVLQNKFDPFHQGDQLNGAGQDLIKVAHSLGIATVGMCLKCAYVSFPFLSVVL